jgi:uncharacterized membrane protein
MTPHALLFTLAAIGISETVYLIGQRRAQKKPICVLGKSCHQVLESRHNKIFGIYNDALGLGFYLVIALMAAFLVIELEPLNLWENLLKALIAGGVLMSLYFTFLQWQLIKAWCFWCLMSALTVFLMALIVLTSDLAFSL